jgi:hypothetical protein
MSAFLLPVIEIALNDGEGYDDDRRQSTVKRRQFSGDGDEISKGEGIFKGKVTVR